jgi:hypothetical protein
VDAHTLIDADGSVKSFRGLDLTGYQFGRLTVLKDATRDGSGRRWLCRCLCGNTKERDAHELRRGLVKDNIQSCGCYARDRMRKRNTTHGLASHGDRHPLYSTWLGMLHRCTDSNHHAFHNYGGRGISVCQRWRESFPAFVQDMGERPKKTELDRINNDGNYEPSNCRWATHREQARNRRDNVLVEFNGRRICVTQAIEEAGANRDLVWDRLKRGWSFVRAITEPARRRATPSPAPDPASPYPAATHSEPA